MSTGNEARRFFVERRNLLPDQRHHRNQNRLDEQPTGEHNLFNKFNQMVQEENDDSDIEVVSVHFPMETKIFAQQFQLKDIPNLEREENDMQLVRNDQVIEKTITEITMDHASSQDTEMNSYSKDDALSVDTIITSQSQNCSMDDMNIDNVIANTPDTVADTVIMVSDEMESDATSDHLNKKQIIKARRRKCKKETMRKEKKTRKKRKKVKNEHRASAYEVQFTSKDISATKIESIKKKKIRVRTVLEIIDSEDEMTIEIGKNNVSTALTTNDNAKIENIEKMSLDDVDQSEESITQPDSIAVNIAEAANDDDNAVVDESLNELQLMVTTRHSNENRKKSSKNGSYGIESGSFLSSLSSINDQEQEQDVATITNSDEEIDVDVFENADIQQNEMIEQSLLNDSTYLNAEMHQQIEQSELNQQSDGVAVRNVDVNLQQEKDDDKNIELVPSQVTIKATFDPSLPKIGSSNWPQVFKNLTYTSKHEHFWTDNFNRVHPKWSKVTNATLHRIYQHPGFYVVQNDNLIPTKQQQTEPNNFTAMLKFGETNDMTKRLSDNSFTSCFFPRTWHLLLFIEVDNKINAQRIESAFKKWLTQRQRHENDVFLLRQRKDVMLVKSWKKLRNDFLRNAHPNRILPTGENFITHFSVKYIGIGKHNDWLIE